MKKTSYCHVLSKKLNKVKKLIFWVEIYPKSRDYNAFRKSVKKTFSCWCRPSHSDPSRSSIPCVWFWSWALRELARIVWRLWKSEKISNLIFFRSEPDLLQNFYALNFSTWRVSKIKWHSQMVNFARFWTHEKATNWRMFSNFQPVEIFMKILFLTHNLRAIQPIYSRSPGLFSCIFSVVSWGRSQAQCTLLRASL